MNARPEESWEYTGTRNWRTTDLWRAGLICDEDGEPLWFAVNPKPLPTGVSHYAAFPPALVTPMLRASCPQRACPECGSPWERIVEAERGPRPERDMNKKYAEVDRTYATMTGSDFYRYQAHFTTLGFRPTCACYDSRYANEFQRARRERKRWQRMVTGNWWERVRRRPGKSEWPHKPGVILDPFAGTGTVGQVAAVEGRDCVLVDLSAVYLDIARQRLTRGLRAAPKPPKLLGKLEKAGQLALPEAMDDGTEL